MKALIVNTQVVQVSEYEFEVHPDCSWVDAPEGCTSGWSYNNGVFSEPTLVELSYKEKRKIEYPSVEDYLDGIVKGDQEQIQEYIDLCLAIKDKYPKPE
jgi:hypothetical protein